MLTEKIWSSQVDFILARHTMGTSRRHRTDAAGGIQGHIQGRGQIQDVSCTAGTGRIVFCLEVVWLWAEFWILSRNFFGAG